MSEPYEQDRQFANAFGGDVRYWAWQWIYAKFQSTPDTQVSSSDVRNNSDRQISSGQKNEQVTERPSVYLLPPPKKPIINTK